MRRVQFAEGECYHLYNRGVEKREVFLHTADYERFLCTLFACNNHHTLTYHRSGYRGLASLGKIAQQTRPPLVDILCFCLMPNHFHVLLQQRVAEGVPRLMQKVGTAYTMYFNTRYERSGALFQGTYHARHVARDSYLLPVSRYIHLNPLDLRFPAWRERGLADARGAFAFLQDYPWSSYGEYTGKSRYAPFIAHDLLLGIFRTADEYATYVTHQLSSQAAHAESPSELNLDRWFQG